MSAAVVGDLLQPYLLLAWANVDPCWTHAHPSAHQRDPGVAKIASGHHCGQVLATLLLWLLVLLLSASQQPGLR